MKALLFCALAAALPALAGTDDSLNGKWQVHQSIAGNDSDQLCTFTQAGGELTGTCETESTGTVIIAGKVEDRKITWSFKSEYNGTPLTVAYEGKLVEGKISGTVSVPEFSVDGDFTAAPAK